MNIYEYVREGINIKDIVEYQSNSIVSKTLIDKEFGTITFFAFDEGQGFSEHSAPYDATVIILDGKAEIYISGKKYDIKAGEMLIMPANKPHALKAVERFKMMLVMIRG